MSNGLYFKIIRLDPSQRTIEVEWNGGFYLNHRLPDAIGPDATEQDVIQVLLQQTPKEALGLVERPSMPIDVLSGLVDMVVPFSLADLDASATDVPTLPEVAL